MKLTSVHARIAAKRNLSVMLTLMLLATAMVSISPSAASPANAANQIQKQTGFNARSWSVTSPDSQGIRYVGGDFTSYQAWNTGSGAAIDATTGEVDPSFPSVSGWPYQKAAIPDGTGGWYIGGGMNNVGGQSVSRIAHLNANGLLDTGWLPTVDGGQGVFAIAKYGDVIIFGGNFTSVNGFARNRIAAIKTDGTLLPWAPDANSAVHAISISGDTVYLGGQFTTLGGLSRNLVGAVRLDARTGLPGETCLTSWNATDCITAWDPNASGWGVKSIVVDTTYTYIIGAISQVGGQSRTGAAKVLTATGVLQPWDGGLDAEAGAGAILNGKIYIGGNFGSAGGQTRRLVAGWDISTGVLEAWNPSVAGNQVTSMSAAANKIFFSGMFSAVGTSSRNHAAAVNALGELLPWDPNACNQVNGTASTVHGISATATQVYMVGDFPCVGGQKRMHAAAVSASGLLTTWAPDINGPVYSFSRTGNTVYIGGNFSSINGSSRSGAAAVDASGAVTAWNPSPDGRAASIIATPNKIFMAGWFNNVGGTPMKNLAALDPVTGALDLTFNAQLNGAVRTMFLDGNDLFIGGDFDSVGGQTHRYIASINATTSAVNTAFTGGTSTGTKTYPFLEAIAVVGQKVFIGGYFGQVNGQTRTHLAALDKITGALDVNWTPIVSRDVYAITPSTDGSVIYVGGSNISVVSGADSAQGVAALDVQTGALTSWRATASEVRGISVSDAVVYVAGYFNSVSGQARQNTVAVSTSGNVLEPWPMNPTEAVTLAVTIPNTAPGAVTSSPGGINCGASCAYSYSVGSSVTLTAVPDTGYELASWTGGCTGTNTTCTVTLTQSASTTATFRAAGAGNSGSSNQNSTPAPTTPTPTLTATPTPTATPTASPSPSAPAVSSSTRAVFFAPGSSKLDASDRGVLNALASFSKPLSNVKVTASGAAQKTNYSLMDKLLATARAKSVIAYLRAKGIKATYAVMPAKPASDSSANGRKATITIIGTK
jgi:outer membrane protein OmpA-like peptidoglycan-associated protein